ncbi:MAG: exo-alpha-sialidase [Solirubrobacterales bacterium]|nr:exo-alpha-sialidase [Solirubrobacterales bacterium]
MHSWRLYLEVALRLIKSPRCTISLLVLLVAVVSLSACGADEATLSEGDGAAEADKGAALEHVHGLGVNPADGRLFIATHNGMFTAAEGETTPEPVGARQDVMGFSVIGPDRFIGSGHPGPDQDLPPSLGLIESRDGGETWESISLLGEADFHVLESAGEKVYGFDGAQGRLLVSSDAGQSWEQRVAPAAMFDLAIDPEDSSSVVAATEEGLFSSTDEGRSWRPLRSDLAGLLAWPNEKRLYLIDGEGRVQLSADGGAVWETVGSVGGQPAALIANQDELYAALVDATVQHSTDGGATWTVRTAP